MSKNKLDRKFKRIELVWILNLLPPCSGFGTIYGAGGGAFFLVVLAWIYLYHSQWSTASFLFVYFVLSILGSMAVASYNADLRARENGEDLWEKAIVEEGASPEAYALSSFQSKINALEEKETNRQDDSPTGLDSGADIVALAKEPDMISTIKSEERELDQKEKSLENLLDLPFGKDSQERQENIVANQFASDDGIAELNAQSDSIVKEQENQDSFVGYFDQKGLLDLTDSSEPAMNTPNDPQEKKDEARPELVEKRQQLLEKLGEATGEFQPKAFQVESEDTFNFSNFDNFKFEPETTINSSIEDIKGKAECIECGAKRDLNFSFCLACGKNVV